MESGLNMFKAPSVVSLTMRHGGSGDGQARSDRQAHANSLLHKFEKYSPPDVERNADPPPCDLVDGVERYVKVSTFLDNPPRSNELRHELQAREKRLLKDIERINKAIETEPGSQSSLGAYSSFKVGTGSHGEVRCLTAELSVAPQFQGPAAKRSPYRSVDETALLIFFQILHRGSLLPNLNFHCSGHRFSLHVMLPYNDSGSSGDDLHYPFVPPKVRFVSSEQGRPVEMKHYAVDSNSGEVCLPITVDQPWSATTKLWRVLKQLETLVVSPGEIDPDRKYSKQSIFLDQLGCKSSDDHDSCKRSAMNAPLVDDNNNIGSIRPAKLQQSRSMLGLLDQMRYMKEDRIRPPEERPANAQPGWPYSTYQPLLYNVWLGGANLDNDALKPFAREERHKRMIMLPIVMPLLILNNMIKKISWFCLILRSLDNLGVVSDIEERFNELFRVLEVVVLSLGYGIGMVLLPVLAFLKRIFGFLLFTLDLSNMCVGPPMPYAFVLSTCYNESPCHARPRRQPELRTMRMPYTNNRMSHVNVPVPQHGMGF